MLEVHKKYRLIFKIGNDTLYYTGTIICIENGFIEFLDKFEKNIALNMDTLQSFEEVKNE